MSKKWLVMVLSCVILLTFAATASAFAPLPRGSVPAEDSSLVVVPGFAPATGCACHTDQAGIWTQLNGRHAQYLRPVPAGGPSAISDNPFFGDLPPEANFSLNPADFNYVDWIIGGMLSSERYIFDALTTIDSVDYAYPAVGNRQWQMYNNTNGYDATERPHYPSVAPGEGPWRSYGTQSYVTGSSTNLLLEGPTNYGCVRCHSYGFEPGPLDGNGNPTEFRIQQWGVTCANCHGATAGAAHVGLPYDGAFCSECHSRAPNAFRSAQLTMQVWETGHARNHRNQGFEVDTPKVPWNTRDADFEPGVVEDASGAGHPNSLRGFMNDTNHRRCYRCHTTEGFIAYSENGTDVPYFLEKKTLPGTRPIGAAVSSGVSCSACHPVHGDDLDTLSLRDYDEPSGLCAECHRDYSLIDFGESIPFDQNTHYPQREMYHGFGGYWADMEPALHVMVGAQCEHCHMVVTVGQTSSSPSHMFRTVMPGNTQGLSYTVTASDGTTTTATGNMPSDSCTGIGCHAIGQRAFLQDVIEARQATIKNKLDQVNALLGATQADFGTTEDWLKARTNWRLVRNDRSYGVHNYYYARDLLNWAAVTLQNLEEEPLVVDGVVPVVRIAGDDRYQTAIQASVSEFEDDSVADVVLATGQDFPDALSASGLAGAVGSPVLLTGRDFVPTGLLGELERLGAVRIHVIGGTEAISQSVRNALTAAGFTVVGAYSGTDRYETALLVANAVATVTGDAFGEQAFLVRGDDPADALTSAPVAYQNAWPVLLTQTNVLSTPARTAIQANGITHVIITGGPVAVSASVMAEVDAMAGVSVERWWGENRYATAIDVANKAIAAGLAGPEQIGVASGADFPDALSGGAVMGARGGIMVLTQPTVLTPATATFLSEHAAMNHPLTISVFGGPVAISDSVRVAIYDAVNP